MKRTQPLGEISFECCGVRVRVEVLEPTTIDRLHCPLCGIVWVTGDPSVVTVPRGTYQVGDL